MGEGRRGQWSSLTTDNVDQVISAATHKTKREVEELVVALPPKPPIRSSVRKLPDTWQRHSRLPTPPVVHTELNVNQAVVEVSRDPAPLPAPSVDASAAGELRKSVQPVQRAAIRPLAPEQYLVKFTASRATQDKLREAQALLRHQVPSGDLAEIFDRALTLLLVELRQTRHAATSRPRFQHHIASAGRHVAAAVKREVWARDGGQCAFVGAAGRCTERGFLEYHHVIPFADQDRVERVDDPTAGKPVCSRPFG